MKKDTINKLNTDAQKLSKELDEKSEKLKESEGKLLNLSNQQAAKMALLNKNKITLRSKSAERDKYEQENLSLKNQLTEANKKISKLTADIEKKGKMKLDLEFRMTPNKNNAESSSKSTENNEMVSENYFPKKIVLNKFQVDFFLVQFMSTNSPIGG